SLPAPRRQRTDRASKPLRVLRACKDAKLRQARDGSSRRATEAGADDGDDATNYDDLAKARTDSFWCCRSDDRTGCAPEIIIDHVANAASASQSPRHLRLCPRDCGVAP